MGQLTLSRFRGDTTFGLVARIVSTFTGCLIGLVMWYVGNFQRLFSRFFLNTAQVHFRRRWSRQPIWTGSRMLGLLSVLLLCAIVLANSSHDKFNHMGYSGIGVIL